MLFRSWNALAICGSASVSTLASSKAPLNSAASFSRIGPSALHGPHHSAQKSTSTGVCRDFCSTSASKVAVVASKTCGRAGESGDIRGIRGVFRPRLCQLAGIPTDCKKYLTLAGSNGICPLHLVTNGLHDEDPKLGISGTAAVRGMGALAAAGRPVAAARLGHRAGQVGTGCL